MQLHLNKIIGVGDFRFSPLAKKYISKVMRTNRLSYGPFHRMFESLFAKMHNVKHAIFCNSGTSALQVALQALKERHGWKDGDEVIVPAVTFVATANIVLHNRMKPVFVDVYAGNYTINSTELLLKITDRTRAIIPVHLMSLPADMGEIKKIAKEYHLKIIEDSCQTMFGKYFGQPLGSMGDIGCFSTYIAHYIITGVGGIATTNDSDLAIRMRSLINHGRNPDYLSIDDLSTDNIQKRFNFVSVGHSFRATELEAAIGLAQLQEADKIVKKRREIAKYYLEGLKDLKHKIQLPLEGFEKTALNMFMLFPLVTLTEYKDNLVRYLEKNGIETRDLCPLITQPIYKDLLGENHFPVAKYLNNRAFYIGCHPYITRKQQDFVIDKFHKYFRG